MSLKKSQRQVQIMALLSKNQKGMSVPELYQALQRIGYKMSERTLRRDMLDLIPVFQITVTGKENAPVYQIYGVRMDNISLGFEDMQAFQLLREMARPYSHLDIGQHMNVFLEKLQAAMPYDQKVWLQRVAELLTVNPGNLLDEQSISQDIRQIIEEGIVSQNCVQIKYSAFYSNTITQRIIEPLLMEFYEGCYHVWAYCHERNAIRDFRLSRIHSATLTSIVFTPRKNLLDKAMINRFERMSAPEANSVTLRFHGFSARYVKEYHHNKANSITTEMDGSIIFKMRTGLTDDVIRWILGFGAEVEVIEPEDLRRRITQVSLDLLKIYKVDS